MHWLNPWAWHLAAIERWSNRFSVLTRWLIVALCIGATAGLAAWFGVSAARDVPLARHGIVVSAVVEQTAPYGDDTQYLLSFSVDGRPDEQWSTDVADLRVGAATTVIVDRRDHTRMESDAAFQRRWIFYAVLLIGIVMLAFASVTFIRMDTAEFQQYTKRSVGGPM
jgi:hypothetical protein